MVESLARPSRPRLVSESSLTADVSSGEEVKPRQIRRPPAKIRSRAKLKNRKKSEATTEFLANKSSVVGTSEGNRQEQENWKMLAEDVVELLEEQPDFCLEVEQLNGLLGGQIGVLGSPGGRLNERDLKIKMVDHVEVPSQNCHITTGRDCFFGENCLKLDEPSTRFLLATIEEVFRMT